MIFSKFRSWAPWICAALLITPLAAQTAAPTTYSVTMVNALFGTPVTQQIYRSGSKVVIENNAQGTPKTRSYYDLGTHTQLTWNPAGNGDDCGKATFSGDWGDPFATAELLKSLQDEHAKQVGTESLNGFQTNVLATDGSGPQKLKAKAWVDIKYGALVKLQMDQGSGMNTLLELKSASFVAPSPAAMAIPAGCAKVGGTAPMKKPPTDAEVFAAETGDKTGTYTKASMIAIKPSQNSCNVELHVMEQGTMKPVLSYQVGLDLKYDVDHPPAYTTGVGTDGHLTFSEGIRKDVTSQVHNGVLKISNAPPTMSFTIGLGKAGEIDAVIYRQCPAPTSVLLLLLKDSQSTQGGFDWVWALTGKYAKPQ